MVRSSVAWPAIPCIILFDPIVCVAVLGEPGAVRLPTPALLEAALPALLADFVPELAALSSTRADAGASAGSAWWAGSVIGTPALTIGAFHLIPGAGIEPRFCHRAVSTFNGGFTRAHWRGEIIRPLRVLSSRSVEHSCCTILAEWAGAVITEPAPALD